MIELQCVDRAFAGKHGAQVAALQDISIQIAQGEFVCITGPSGSGKTTLMNIIGCLDKPSTGTYRVLGRPLNELRSDDLAMLRQRLFGFVFQSYNLLDGVTAIENVALPGTYSGISRRLRTNRARDLLSKLGLAAREGGLPAELSGGEQQRVALARALINGGQIILADEPTGALDRQNGEQVLRALEDLAARGHTIVMVSHDPDIAARARRRIELVDGRVVGDSGSSIECGAVEVEKPATLTTGMSALGAALGVARSAFRSAFLHRRRTILLAGCIAIAVCLGVATPSVSRGIYRHVFDRVNLMGMDAIAVFALANAPESFGGLSELDARAIAREVPNVRAVSPETYRHWVTVSRDDVNAQMSVRGFVDQGDKDDRGLVSGYHLRAGNFITQEEDDNLEKVAVLGDAAYRRLFRPGEHAVGQTIMIENVPFRVKGILAYRGGILAGESSEEERLEAEDRANNWVDAPYKTVSSLPFASDSLSKIVAFVHNPTQMDETANAIRNLGIRRYGGEVFTFEYPQKLLKSLEPLRRRVSLIFGTLAGIALLAGNAIVMANMLMSVRARQREIGIRIAVGARRRDIWSQFLSEAMVVSVLGSLLGVLLALALLTVLSKLGVPSVLSILFFAIPFVCAIMVGVFSGIVPAHRAARLDPVSALAAD